MPLSIEAVNQLSATDFQEQFKNVVECLPEAGVFASALLPFRNLDQLVFAFNHFLEQLPADKKKQVLQKHPELGEAKLNSLTDESKNEQQGAGLDQFGDYNIEEFNSLKIAYRSKFDFPFVICVRQNTRDSIVRALKRRVDNTIEEELQTGVGEVKKICEIRIRDIVN